MNPLNQYLDDLLQKAGVPELTDPEVITQLKTDMSERVAALINRRLIDALPDEKVTELDALLDQQPDNAEAFQNFIEQNVPQKDKVVAATLLEFQTLYLGAEA